MLNEGLDLTTNILSWVTDMSSGNVQMLGRGVCFVLCSKGETKLPMYDSDLPGACPAES